LPRAWINWLWWETEGRPITPGAVGLVGINVDVVCELMWLKIEIPLPFDICHYAIHLARSVRCHAISRTGAVAVS